MLGYCDELVAQIEYPDVDRPSFSERIQSAPPRQLSDGVPETYWVLTLDEVVKFGLKNSDVLREIGGRVLDFPSAMTSVYDPSITMSHPRLGEEAALSAFDAQFAQQFTAAESSNVFNNSTLGGGATEINQDLFRIQTELRKVSATGAQYTIRNLVEHDHSNAPFNLLSHAWNGSFEASVRQPLLQGAGVMFNRIAGPSGSVDLSLTRGVILARIDGDISIAEFEKGVRDYVRQLENAYWRLYSSYRSLDANRRARDLARSTWQTVKARSDANMQGGEADVEAQAREQLYLFEQLVVDALTGQNGGVYQAERQLRQLLGLPVNDGRLIRPADEPTDAPVRFDWNDCMADAMSRRVELRQQLWRIKQRELELLAARNFLLPRLDAVATYRIAGFGDDLIGGDGAFTNLFREMSPFDNDELEVGLQLNVPIGYRQQFAGVRHSELNLCRERALLKEQEHAITHGLAGAIAGIES
ncbi:MAG: TolC family protein, partial [Planctomycetota bacterium]